MAFLLLTKTGILLIRNHLGSINTHYQDLYPSALPTHFWPPPIFQIDRVRGWSLFDMLVHNGYAGLRVPMSTGSIHLEQKHQGRDMYQCASVLHHRFSAERFHRLRFIGSSASRSLESEYDEGAENISNGDIPTGLTVSKVSHFEQKKYLSSPIGHV